MARTDHGNTLLLPVLKPDSTRFNVTRSGFDTGTRTFCIDSTRLQESIPELDRADTDLLWVDRTGSTQRGTYSTMYVSGIGDIIEGKNGICEYTVNYLGLIKSQKRSFETSQTQTTPTSVTVGDSTFYTGATESVPVVTIVRVTKTRPDKSELGNSIAPPGWESYSASSGYSDVAFSGLVQSGWVLNEREEERCGTIWQVADQYVFQILRQSI